MKVLLLMITFVCIVLIGLMINNYYKKRKDFFCDLCAFCDTLKVSISYSQNKLSEIIFDFKKICGKDFCNFLLNFELYLEKGCENDKSQICGELKILSEKETQDIIKFFSKLGSLGVDEEVEKIVLNKNLFLKIKEKCEEQERKLSPLYIKLFVVLALGMLIIFL
ncbi:MAG: hypothetical protein EOM55_03200 [Clostridia bacterium]|nr:hypothetical protein [Clostridia bacterium]